MTAPSIPRPGQQPRTAWWRRPATAPNDPLADLGPETQVPAYAISAADGDGLGLLPDEHALLNEVLMAETWDDGHTTGYVSGWRWGAICGALACVSLWAGALAMGSLWEMGGLAL